MTRWNYPETNLASVFFSHLFQSDPVRGVLLLPVLLGVASNGNGKGSPLGLLCVYVCTHCINMISCSHIAYFFSSPFGTIRWKRIRNRIFSSVSLVSGLEAQRGANVKQQGDAEKESRLREGIEPAGCERSVPVPEMWREEQQFCSGSRLTVS